MSHYDPTTEAAESLDFPLYTATADDPEYRKMTIFAPFPDTDEGRLERDEFIDEYDHTGLFDAGEIDHTIFNMDPTLISQDPVEDNDYIQIMDKFLWQPWEETGNLCPIALIILTDLNRYKLFETYCTYKLTELIHTDGSDRLNEARYKIWQLANAPAESLHDLISSFADEESLVSARLLAFALLLAKINNYPESAPNHPIIADLYLNSAVTLLKYTYADAELDDENKNSFTFALLLCLKPRVESTDLITQCLERLDPDTFYNLLWDAAHILDVNKDQELIYQFTFILMQFRAIYPAECAARITPLISYLYADKRALLSDDFQDYWPNPNPNPNEEPPAAEGRAKRPRIGP